MPSRSLPAGRALRLAAATALVAGTLVAGVTPVAASSNLTIMADQPPGVAPAGHLWAFNNFFPRTLTVHKGQTVKFAIMGFHTATLLPKGMSASTDLRKNGAVAADAEDTTPNPGGQTHTQLVVPNLLPTSMTCGTAAAPCSFTGDAVVSSGAPLGPGAPAPFVVTINAPVGDYTLHCRIHPGMDATIHVAPASAPATNVTAYKAAIKAQVASDIKDAYLAEKQASTVTKAKMPNGHTHWWVTAGTSSAGSHVAILEFLPGKLDVKKGDLVTWRSPAANKPHTVTFPDDLFTDQVPMCENADGTDSPATPTVIPPTGPGDFACGTAPDTHPADEIEFAPGNGNHHLYNPTTVSDSGLLASSAELAAFGLPASAAFATWTIGVSATATPGTYTFVCQVHDGMKATLVVH